MKPAHLLLALIIVASWGIHPIIIRIGVLEMPPLMALVLRFVATILVFLPFTKMKMAYVKPIAIFALIWPIGNLIGVFLAVHFIPASSFIVLSQAMVPIGVILGWFFLKEDVRWKSWAGIALSVIGLLVIFGAPHMNAAGVFFSLLNALTGALLTLHFKSMKDVAKITTIVYGQLMALPVLVALTYFFESGQIAAVMQTDWLKMSGVLAYQVFAMTAAMVGWHFLSIHTPMSKLIPFSMLQPVFGVSAGVLLLHETLTHEMIVGGTLVMIGISIVILRKAQKAAKA